MPIFDSQYPVNSNPAGEDKILTTDTSDASAVKSVTLTKVQEWLGSNSKWVVNSMIADGAVDTLQIADGAVTPAKQGDTGWVTVPINGGTNGFSLYDSGFPIKIRRVGNIVELVGAASPNSGAVSTGSGTLLTIPEGYRYNKTDTYDQRVYRCQGSSNNSWGLNLMADNTVSAGRYGPGNWTTNAWLPFSVSWMVD